MMTAGSILALWFVSWPIQLVDVGGAAEALASHPAHTNRVLEKEVVIQASLDRVWDAWTTEEGIRFVSPVSNIDLRPGGAYELFLNLPADERGRRGAEGSRVLTVLPRQLLAFDWTFPPSVPGLRREGAKTHVAVFFTPVDGGIRLRLVQYGWGDGPEWEAGYRYFDEAWSGVLEAMKAHFEAGDARATLPPSAGMVESLRSFVEEIAQRLSEEGPEAWLPILDSSAPFLMVSEGAIAFPDRPTAERFLKEFDGRVSAIQARFTTVRVDSLGRDLAAFGASYHERIDLKDGSTTTFEGYVTGIARRTEASWHLQQLHWSSLPPTRNR